MRLKLLLFSLVITFFSSSLLSEENNSQNTLDNKNFNKVIIHVVKKGDTLSSLSKKYSIEKESIIKANKLSDENYIYVGQNLKIVKNLFLEDKNDKIYYHEVKKGENLTEIANKYDLTVSELIEINKIGNQDLLTAGTKLKLKEKISTRKETPTVDPKDQIDIDKIIVKNSYGPLLIESEKINIKRRKNFLKASHKNGKRLILQLNCDKKEINVRGVGRKWKGWMPAKEQFEIKLLNDFC